MNMFGRKKELESIHREYQDKLNTIREAHQAEIQLLKEAHAAEISSLQEAQKAQLQVLYQESGCLKEKCEALQSDNDRVYAGHKGMEEEIHFLKYRIQTLDELHESVVFGNWPHDGSFRGYTCRYPFERIEILPRGEVYTCCSGHIKHNYYIGNIYEENASLAEIWNSTKAKKLRYAVEEGNFEFCQKNCRYLYMAAKGAKEHTLQLNPVKPLSDKRGDLKKTWQDYTAEAMPKYIMLSCDESCNLQCPTCRSSVRVLEKRESERLYQRLMEVVRPALKDCELLGALGTGELFASSAVSRFLQTVCAEEFPKLSLILTTNLQLLDQKKWEEFPNLLGMPKTIRVSVDAATKEVYEENRCGGGWERLLKNLAYLCSLRKDPDAHVEYLCLNFVVQKNNYEEMEAFADMAERMGVDAVEFQRMGNWGTFTGDEYKKRDVFSVEHPDYKKAVSLLQKVMQRDGKKIEVIQNILLG